MPFQPLHDFVVVVLKDEEKVTESGLVLPGASEKVQTAVITAVGPGLTTEIGDRTPLSVAVGETVLLSKYAGIELKLDGVACRLVKESEIFGVLTK
jgi:chaperonin GroES